MLPPEPTCQAGGRLCVSTSDKPYYYTTVWLPANICECARRLVCHRLLIPLWCSLNQPRLHQQTPRAHWSACSLCSSLEYPSGSASVEPMPQWLQNQLDTENDWPVKTSLQFIHIYFNNGLFRHSTGYPVDHWAWSQRHWWCNQPSVSRSGPHLQPTPLRQFAQCGRTAGRQPVRSSWWLVEGTGREGTRTAPPSPAPSVRGNTRSTHSLEVYFYQ